MRFGASDRELLLRSTGMGPLVIERLIAIAYDEPVRHGLATRRRALLRALELTGAQRQTFNSGPP